MGTREFDRVSVFKYEREVLEQINVPYEERSQGKYRYFLIFREIEIH